MVKTASTPQVLRTGSRAPDFTLKGVDGMMHSLQDYKSKATLVVFICNHCPYVKARISDMVALQSTFKTSELQVIGINSNDPNYKDEGFDNMLIFANEYKLNFPYLIDESQDVRSEEHTSELQSRQYLVCRLLLEKKNKYIITQLYS